MPTLKPFTALFILSEQSGRMKLTERLVCARVCLCPCEGCTPALFELAHTPRRHLPSDYRRPAPTQRSRRFPASLCLRPSFVGFQGDAMKHE